MTLPLRFPQSGAEQEQPVASARMSCESSCSAKCTTLTGGSEAAEAREVLYRYVH